LKDVYIVHKQIFFSAFTPVVVQSLKLHTSFVQKNKLLILMKVKFAEGGDRWN